MKNLTRFWLVSCKVRNSKTIKGYTLIEALVVVVMVGILSAIAAPGWVGFVANQRARVSQSKVYSAIKDAQSQAKVRKARYQISFRNVDNTGQYVVHPTNSKPLSTEIDKWNALFWQDLEPEVELDATALNSEVPGQIRSFRFDFDGTYDGLNNRYLKIKQKGNTKYCLFISTKLGALQSFTKDETSSCD